MGIGLGIVLVLAGLILVADVITVGIAFVDEGALGWILLVVGILAIVLAMVMNHQRTKQATAAGGGTVVDQRQPPPNQPPPNQPPPQH